MAHLRGSGLAILVVLLLAGAALAAGDQIADLENKVAKMEAMLKEEPAELLPMILRELTAARRELRQALQERFDLLSQMAATTPDEQKAKAERLDKLRSRVDELNRQLGEAATTQPAAQPPAAPPAQPSTAQPTAPSNPAPSAPAQPSAPPAADAPQADAQKFDAPKAPKQLPFASKVDPLRGLKLRVDVLRDWSAADAKKSCSNRAYSHSAGVWRVEVIAYPEWEQSTDLVDEDGLLSHKDGDLYIAVATVKQNAGITMVAGSRTYVATPEPTKRDVKLVFDRLTLAEASDLVDHLAENKDEIIAAYGKAVSRYEIFQVAFELHSPEGRGLEASQRERALSCKVDSIAEPSAFRQQLLRAKTAIEIESCESLDAQGKPVRKPFPILAQVREPIEKTHLLKSATFDTDWVNKVKAMIPELINTEQNAISSRNVPSKAARTKKEVAKEEQAAPTGPSLIVDDPCFQLSAAPVLSGMEFHPATNFRFRYDLYSPDDKVTLKLRGEGETADTGAYFQRMKISGEGTGLFVKGRQSWQVAGAVVGDYSFTRKSNSTLDEWKAGGKLEVKAPFVRIFDTGSGANSRPTLSLEGAAAGGNGSATKTTDFAMTTSFVYTLRPSPRFSLDLRAVGGWSNKARFATEKNYSYFNVLGRFNFNADWDYMVKYECGRKDPDYRKFCGWQTGFVLVTGR